MRAKRAALHTIYNMLMLALGRAARRLDVAAVLLLLLCVAQPCKAAKMVRVDHAGGSGLAHIVCLVRGAQC